MKISGAAGIGLVLFVESKDLRVVITGGGTGGHLFPGIAVAQEIHRRGYDTEIVFVGTGRQVDKDAMKQYGLTSRTIHCGALKGGSIFKKLMSLIKLPVSLIESIILMVKIRPHFVIGVGGYVTGPVVFGAKILGIPACIHEQNSIPGMANRKLGPIFDGIWS